MPRRATARGRGFGSRKIPNFEWSALVSTAFTTVPLLSKVIVGSFSLNEPEDRTLVRVRGSYLHKSDQAGASEVQFGAWGMILVTEDAFAIGITAIPGPVSDSANDWAVWQPLLAFNTQATSVGFETRSGLADQVDSKAQRIWQQGTRLVLVAENTNITGGFDFAVSLRILTRLRT